MPTASGEKTKQVFAYSVPVSYTHLVGMGEALWDCLPEGKKIGGAPANFAYHVSQFGFDSRVVSAVGIDASLSFFFLQYKPARI